ncbi:Dynein-1-beta heavy chain [Durusdinium trenchii]|uniref:Flagellar inner arm I1 complex (1-beta DHC) (Dynein-1) n=1 Tax=Durusdinium trenchii TaxID=1381693 RepID=A0ABP0MZZ3_9DINO
MGSLKEQIEAKTNEIRMLGTELESEISRGMPFRDDMDKAAQEFDPEDQAEILRLAKKPEELVKVMSCVVFVLYDLKSHDSMAWVSKALSPNFIFDLRNFDPDSLSEERLQRLDEHCIDPSMTLDKMDSWRVPKITKAVNRWLSALRGYAKIAADVKPRMQQFERLQQDLHDLMNLEVG